MRYLVGNGGSRNSVIQLSGAEAVNLTGLAPEVGSDLMQLIGDPTLQ